MAGSGDDLALLHGFAADLAHLIAGIAVLGAGGGLSILQFRVMPGSGDGQGLQGGLLRALGVGKQLAADAALPVGLDAGGLAGGGDLCHGGQLVAVGGDGLGPGVGIGDAVPDHRGGIGADAALGAGAAGGDLAGNGGLHAELLMRRIHGAEEVGIGAEVLVPGPHGLAVHMAVRQPDIHGAGGEKPILARLAVPVLIELPVGGAVLAGDIHLGDVKGHGDLRILGRQGLGGELDVFGHVLGDAVGEPGRHLHAGVVELLADLIGGAVRLPGDLQSGHAAAQTHHISGVVLEVDVALAVGNGAAQSVLSLVAAGGEQHIGRLDGHILAILGIGLHGGVGVVHLGHARLIPQDPQLAGGEVVEEIDVSISVLALIGGGQQTAGLGIALGGDGIGDGEAGQVHHGDVVAGVGPELAGAGYADIGAAVVDHGGGGAHGRRLVIAAAVVQVQALQGAIHEGAVLVGLDLIQIAALGGEVIRLGGGVIGDAAAQIAHAGGRQLVQQLAGLGIQGQDGAVGGDIAAVAVIGGHQDEVAAGVGPGPIEAVVGIRPGGQLGLLGILRVLIGDGDAGEVGLLGLGVPEAGVDIPVAVGDGAVGLAAQRIGIDPQGLQGLGVKGLDPAVAEAHEDHAVGIGGGVDGEGGAGHHGAAGHHRAGVLVELHDLVAGIGIQIAAGDNGVGHGAAAVALAGLVGPHQHRILGLDGGGCLDDAVVVAVGAEQGPVTGLQNVLMGVVRSLLQLHGDILVGFTGNEVDLLAHIAAAGHHQGIGPVGVQGIGPGSAGQDALAADVGGQEHRGVGGIGGDGGLHRGQLVDLDGIGLGHGGGVLVGDGNGDGLLQQGGVQGDGHRLLGVGLVIRVIGDDLAPVAAGHGNGHVRVVAVAGQRPHGHPHLRHPLAQRRGVIQHQLVKALGGVVLLLQGDGAVIVVRQAHAVEGHGALGGQDIALIEGHAVDGLGLGHLQLHGVAVAACGHKVGQGAIAGVLRREGLFIVGGVEVAVEMAVIHGGGHIALVRPDTVQVEVGAVGLHVKGILMNACGKGRGHGIGNGGLAVHGGLGRQAGEPVLHNGRGHSHGQACRGLHGGGGVIVALLGGNVGIALAGDQGIHGGPGIGLLGGQHGSGVVGQLHRYVVVVGQGHGHAVPLFHQHGIGDDPSVIRQDDGHHILAVGVLLAGGQGHVDGNAALGLLPGHGHGRLGAQGGGVDVHGVLRGHHAVFQGLLVEVQLHGRGGVEGRQVRQAGGAENVHGIGLVLLVIAHGIPGLHHHVGGSQAVVLDDAGQGGGLALPYPGVGACRWLAGQVYAHILLAFAGADALAPLKIGHEVGIGIVGDPERGSVVGLVELGNVLAVLPLVVDAQADALDPLAGGQRGGNGSALGRDLHGAPDMVDAAVGQVKRIGGGHQLHAGSVLHGGDGAELTGEGGHRRGHGGVVLGGADGHRHLVALLEGLELFHPQLQLGQQRSGLAVGGGIEGAVGGVIGRLGGGIILHAVGGRAIGRHALRQVQQAAAIALAGVGGEPDGRQPLGRGVQLVAVSVIV